MSSVGVGCSLSYEKMCAVPRSSSSLATSFPWQLSAGKNNGISSMLGTDFFKNIRGSSYPGQRKGKERQVQVREKKENF